MDLALAVQLYTLRSYQGDFNALLKEVADAGYEGVETVGTHGLSSDDMNNALNATNLKVVSSHVALADAQNNVDEVVRFHKAVGNDTVIIPYLQEQDRPDSAQGWRDLGKTLGELAARYQTEGVHLLYHNHDFEMQDYDGKTALEWLFMDAPALGLELDLAWVVRGGKDPFVILEAFKGRCKRVHVKDLQPEASADKEGGFADVGSGTLSWPALLAASKEAGVDWYVVEHDFPSEPVSSIRNSAAFLKSL